jgi:hypothetical protein
MKSQLNTLWIFFNYKKNINIIWSAWLSGKVLDLRAKGLEFASLHTGHVQNPWSRFESTLPRAIQQ